MLDTALTIVLVLNTIWFFGGYHTFDIRGRIFAKIVVPREHRDTPVMETLVHSGKFVAGFNLAFMVLNALLLFNMGLFDKNLQWTILLLAFAVAHGTQFAYNVPVALQNRRGEGVWQVKGLMLFIFVTDFTLMMFNGILSLLYLI
ncbi:hypothetical protein [Pseudoteredinibacter isoporae]|uniref:DUF1761 domain-containing protein n=1 Tax=Pseudoteredinibacter isoporae TaxID=570281 RepID=A0A7X0JWX5_9GAMM|nr:hypothetical protein [Pseudoteredinibacter isoporae]MBB6523015.1 hypothetical protein [Pseudoteredinibacter isoporae]NHO88537.1 hypothetical protein [Pseudoteredinibacter isoporae]NIB22772.1 hypothetical protein [Pseudoteredinibacter isoporae]